MKRILLLFIVVLCHQNVFSQLADCSGAIPVCETGTQNYTVTGIGVDDFPGANSSGCLGAGGAGLSTVEGNSIWFRFRAAASGEMGFNIIPFDTTEDWDFALYGPTPTCGSLGTPMLSNDGLTTVCNYAGQGGSGNTGAGVDPVTGTQTARYSPYFNVVAGEEYILLINSWAGNNNQFTLEWTGRLVANTTTNPLDCSIVPGELGLDQDVCEGTVVTLDATPTNGTATGYVWSLDTGSGFVNLAETGPILTINNDQSGTYKVEVTDTSGTTGEDEVVINFYAQPVANALADPTYEICDDNLDGTVSFDLQTLFAAEILGAQDPAIFEVAFFASQADADGNTSPLPNPYVNTNATETIYARVHNIASPTTCTIPTTNFTITVNPLPAVQNPTNYEVCDDNNDGDDTNGFVQNFILGNRDIQILGGLLAADYDIAYYLTANDADTESNPINKVNPFTNTTRQQEIYVVVTNNTTNCKRKSVLGDPNFGTLTLQVNELPVVTTPVTLTLCDTDNDGITAFDLTTANASISSGVGETFNYFPTLVDAQNNTASITTPNSFNNRAPNTDTVWARVTNTNGCYRIAEINLTVDANIVPVTLVNTYSACDDFNIGVANSDLDGTTIFDFSSINNDIIALFPAGQTLTITHYATQADALAGMNAIADISNYRNTGAVNPQPIYTRVENGVCAPYVGNHVMLSVDPVPSADAVNDIAICDDNTDGDDTNGIIQSFDLESQTATILGTQNAADYTVTYHASASDANTGTAPLSSPYTNTTANQQTIYVRVTNNMTSCFTDHTTFDLIVHPLPVIATPQEIRQCDADANPNDGFSFFNLTEANSLFSTNHANETFEYYGSQTGAQNATASELINTPTSFQNRTVSTDTVWARIINNNGCFRVGQLNLISSTSAIPNVITHRFNVCDDFDGTPGSDTDGTTVFDFSSVDAQIRALFPQAVEVSYYQNEADSAIENAPITNTSSFRNTLANTVGGRQIIWVRVESTLNEDCLGRSGYIELIIDPIPVANPVTDLELCDDFQDGNGTNGFVQSFDLESQTATILGTQNPANYAVTYHISNADASTGANPLSSPFTNTIAGGQEIFVRVTNTNNPATTNQCVTYHTSFNVVVNPLPIANAVPDLEVCDDAADGSPTNGFAQGINLEVQTPGILGTQDPNQFTVTYHGTLAEAQAGIVPLVSNNFSNSVQNRQTIWVRVYNSVTQCANGISNFDVIVNPEPVFTAVSTLEYCDNDDNGEDDTDGIIVGDIDLTQQTERLIDPAGTGQVLADFTVTYYTSQADATAGMNAIADPSNFTNTVPRRQTIYVRIQNNITGCANDEAFFDVVVNPLPDFQVTTPQIVCLNGPNLTIRVENPADTYDYVWTDPNGNNIVGSFLTISSGGLYSITATMTDGTNCSRTRTIQVNESIIATITQDDVTIVDDSDNNSITIDPTNLGIGDYEYALTDQNNVFVRSYQDSPLFERLEGGFYNILVRDKNGCGEVSLLVSVVEFPKFFTPNNDGINDTWIVKGANSTFFPTSSIYIFNRYGKVVANIPIDSQGWNGSYGGNNLPSDDYWFAIKLVDQQGTIRERKGNFSLLRK